MFDPEGKQKTFGQKKSFCCLYELIFFIFFCHLFLSLYLIDWLPCNVQCWTNHSIIYVKLQIVLGEGCTTYFSTPKRKWPLVPSLLQKTMKKSNFILRQTSALAEIIAKKSHLTTIVKHTKQHLLYQSQTRYL